MNTGHAKVDWSHMCTPTGDVENNSIHKVPSDRAGAVIKTYTANIMHRP